MNGTNDTNAIVSGSGTAADPYTYNFHTTSETFMMPHFMFYAVLILIVVVLAATGGFTLGFYFRKRRKKSN
jgi:hypothetical protein